MEEIVVLRIREFIKDKKMTSKELASALNLSEANLSNKLTGSRKMDL